MIVPAPSQHTSDRVGPPRRPPVPPGDVKREHALVRPTASPIHLEPGVTFTLGRLPTCSLPIESASVSRLHAEIRWRGETPVLFDRSSFGTLVDARPIQEHVLEPGEVIQIGPFQCTYEHGPRRKEPTLSSTATVAGEGEMFAGVIDAPGGLAGHLQSFEFHARTGTLVVFGFERGKHAQLVLKDGVPLTAAYDDLVDDEAILAMLEVDHGRFTFMPELGTIERRVARSVTGLLLEAGRRRDERQSSDGTKAPA